MLEVPTGESIGIKTLDGGIIDEVPIAEQLDLHVVDAFTASILDGKLHALECELVVLVMTVHEDDLTGALANQAVCDVARQRDQRRSAKAGGAGEVESAATALLRAETVIDRCGNDAVDLAVGRFLKSLGGFACHSLGECGIDAHGHMRSVLLKRSDRDEEDGIAFKLVAIGERVHFFHVHAGLHRNRLPSTSESTGLCRGCPSLRGEHPLVIKKKD